MLEHPPLERFQQERRRAGSSRRGPRQAAEQYERGAAGEIRVDAAVDGVGFVSLFIGSSISPVAIGSLQAGLVEVYGDEGYELGRQALMGIGGIESADAGKAVASLGLDGDEFEAAFQRCSSSTGSAA